jgi:hypothetical protein
MSDRSRAESRRCGEPMISLAMLAPGLVKVTVRGAFGSGALAASRQLADDVLALEPAEVVLDLSRAHCDATTVPVLALLRRYAARRNVRLGLTSTSRMALALLRRAGQSELFRVVRPADLPLVVQPGPAASCGTDPSGIEEAAS